MDAVRFMMPAQVFWRGLISSKPDDSLISKIALKCLAFLGLVLAAPFYLIGRIFEALEPTPRQVPAEPVPSPVIPNQVVRVEPVPPPPVVPNQGVQVEPVNQPNPLPIRNREIDNENQNLRLLQELSGNPSWENFRRLPFELQYLIAGRYTYPYLWGWNFSSKQTLLNEFLQRFEFHPDLGRARLAIAEAVVAQSKIAFVALLKETLRRYLPVAWNRSGTFLQALHFIGVEHGCVERIDPVQFGGAHLNNSGVTMRALDRMMRHLKDAHDPNYRPPIYQR